MKSFRRHITESEYIPMTIGDKSYKVYTTNDEQSFQRGMMFRESLEHDRGMIFVFETEDTHGMWMKNTRIPLDVIWINEDGRVVDVQTLQPFDTRGAYPAEKAKYVIELNAGEFRGAIGDMIIEKKQRSMVDKADRLSTKMNIKNISTNPEGNNTMHSLDRKIGKNNVNMTAHHHKGSNISKIDFDVDSEGTARTGKHTAKQAKRIITHAAAFINRHHKNMGGGDHQIQFDSHRGSHAHANPEARTSIYRRVAKAAAKHGWKTDEREGGHKNTFTLTREQRERVKRRVTARKGNSYVDIGHFKFDDIKPSKGFESPHYSLYIHQHGGKKVHTQPLTDKIENHATWKQAGKVEGSGKPYVQGRIDHIKKQISMVAVPVSTTTNPRVIDRMKDRIHAHAAEHHPKYKVIDHS